MTQYWILNHWRVALLGLTGIALSIASGWTTWDGMANFTREPLLSLLITFGIQSVMLVTAWLIGETFANRLRSRTARRASAPSGLVIAAITVFGAALATALAIIILGGTATLSNLMLWASDMWLQARFGVGLATLIAMTIAAAVVALSFRAIAADLAGILRVVFDHILLWVMFVACMAASVFFSFDSLFNVVFPETERAAPPSSVLRAVRTRSPIASDPRLSANASRSACGFSRHPNGPTSRRNSMRWLQR